MAPRTVNSKIISSDGSGAMNNIQDDSDVKQRTTHNCESIGSGGCDSGSGVKNVSSISCVCREERNGVSDNGFHGYDCGDCTDEDHKLAGYGESVHRGGNSKHSNDDGGDEGDKDVHVEDNDDDGDDDDDDDDEDPTAIPVDRGRAWLVMISCFLMHILVVGGGKSFGVFVQEFQDRFQVGAKELGVINGIALMLMLGLGIFVNMLAVRFSARRVVTAGSVLASAGFVMTAFIPSFNWLYVTYGLVTGMGLALSFSPTIVMIGQCFKKYRSFALGFALSGAGLGAFAFPALARVLINQYGLRGCLLIIGAVMFNVAICGFLLPPHRRRTSKKIVKQYDINNDERDRESPLVRRYKHDSVLNGRNSDYKNTISRGCELDSSYFERKTSDEGNKGFKNLEQTDSYKVIGEYLVDGNNIKIEVMEDSSSELEKGTGSPELATQMLDDGNEKKHFGLSTGCIRDGQYGKEACESDNDEMANGTENHLSKSDNFLHVYDPCNGETNRRNLLDVDTRKDRKSISTSHLSDILKSKTLFAVQNAISNTSQKKLSSSLAYISNCNIAMASQGNLDRLSIRTSWSRDVNGFRRRGKSVKEKVPLFEWSLLRSPSFIMHFFSAYLGYTCYITNLFMLADYASTCGLDRDTAAFTLSVVGILELVARLTFPLISEVLCCSRRFSWAVSLVVMGILNIVAPHMNVLSSIMTYAVLFGYSCGCFTCLIPVLCAEIKGPEKMGSSFGLTTIAMGLAVMTGPPLCGTIKDVTGNWDISFVTVGSISIVAAALAFLEPSVQKRCESS